MSASFDELSKTLAVPTSRRRVLGVMAGTMAASALGVFKSDKASAQEADPDVHVCPPDQVHCGGNFCCGQNEACCGGQCIPAQTVCCPGANPNNQCGPGEVCSTTPATGVCANLFGGQVPVCCPAAQVCGGVCCAPGCGVECVNGVCCPFNQVCNGPNGPVCCAPGQTCNANTGTCFACPAGSAVCNGQCCPANFGCVNGVCACQGPNITCGNQCCAPNQQCVNGVCQAPPPVCPAGQSPCGNPAACCPNGQCVNGVCQPQCPPGTVLCGNTCTNLANNAANCGACGNVCPAGTTCVNGVCTCPAGTTTINNACCPNGNVVNFAPVFTGRATPAPLGAPECCSGPGTVLCTETRRGVSKTFCCRNNSVCLRNGTRRARCR